MFSRRIILSFITIFFIAGMFASPAFAIGKNIINEGKTVMPANESVDNIIVVGHDIDIKGKVDISAIVINGNLRISKSAKIDGIVLVINGNVKQEPGSYVKESILALKFKSDTVNHLLLGFGLLLSSWLLRFILSTGLVLVSVLVSLLIKNKGERSLELLKHQPGKLIIVGAAVWVVLLGIILLLIISVFGIPLAILLALPPFIAFLIGLTIMSQYIGGKMISRFHPSNWITAFVGSFMILSIFNYPFFGFIALLCMIWFSTGLMIMWMREKLPKKKN